MKSKHFITLIILLIMSIQSLAQTGDAVHFIGTDGNWFEPTNWDSGTLPDATTNIVLTSGQSIVIDPTMAPTPIDALIIINNIEMTNATLSLLQGSHFQYNQMLLNEGSLLDSSSSEMMGDEVILNTNGINSNLHGIVINPTTNDNRSVKITAKSAGIQIFLGGTIAASPGNVGVGHYATLVADDIELDGSLEIDTIYGFQPQVGDVFEIIKARNSFSGAFNNYREGDVVASFDGIDLVLSYENNTDGSTSVLLTSVQWPFRMTFVGNDGNWFNPNNWLDNNTGMPANRLPSADDNIVIAGDMDVLIDPVDNQPIVIRNMIIDDDRTLNIAQDSEFEFQQLHIKNGLLETHSSIIRGSHLQMESSPTSSNNANSKANRPGGWGCSHCGIVLGNPSLLEIDVQNYDGILAVGLGGNIQAQDNKVGAGYYASFVGDNINISGELEVQLFYGFIPSDGDTFQIITTNNLSGQFNGLSEGAIVASFDNIDLTISYIGGDGNDVVLTAVEIEDLIFRNSFE
ncbi:MAG: hypothetical protein AB8B80_16085 [Marinicellaceae bacterium]